MTLKRIYIARHGYRANWLPPPHPPNPTGIHSDPPLAPHGVDQAKQLAAFLTSLPSLEQPQFILSSPFYRCVETAKPIAEMLSLKVALERGVGEWYRKNRRVIPLPADYDDLTKFFPDILVTKEQWHRDNTLNVIPSPDGETVPEIFERGKKFWPRLFAELENHPEIENILIITHAATKIALGTSLLGLRDVSDYIDDNMTTLRAGACSLDKYVLNENGKWEIKMNGETNFLTDGEEMHWDFSSTWEAGSDEDIAHRKREAEKKKKLKEAAEKKSQKEPTPITETASPEAVLGDEFEDFYVTVDIPMIGKNQNFDDSSNSQTPRSKVNIIKPSAQFQITELSNEKPLIKLSNNNNAKGAHDVNNATDSINNINVIDGKIYETSWRKLVGTDLIFDDYGELIGKVTEHLTCNENVKIIPHEAKIKEENEDEDDIDVAEEGKIADKQSSFLKRAVKYAKKKAET